MGGTLPYLYSSLQAGIEAPEDIAVFVLSKVVSGSLLCMQHLQLVGGSGLGSSTELRMAIVPRSWRIAVAITHRIQRVPGVHIHLKAGSMRRRVAQRCRDARVDRI